MNLKVKFFLLIGLLVYTQTKGQEINNNLSDLKLYGKVKSISSLSYKLWEDDNGIQSRELAFTNTDGEEGYFSKSLEFNTLGNIVEEVRYKADGSLDSKKTYKYDEDANVLEMQDFQWNGKLFSSYNYYYNDQGNKILQVRLSPEREIYSINICQHNDQGHIVEERGYNGDGLVLYTSKYHYNNNGILYEILVFNESNTLTSKQELTYDNDGNLISLIKYASDGSISSKGIREYNHLGNKTKEDLYMMGEWLFKMTFRYEYDDKNNWIRRIEYNQQNHPSYLIEREITYY